MPATYILFIVIFGFALMALKLFNSLRAMQIQMGVGVILSVYENPLLFWIVIAFYGIASFVQGIVLSVVFQMAHCVEEAEFPMPTTDTGRIESSWAVHQIETTVNFAPRSRLLSWFVGVILITVVPGEAPVIVSVMAAFPVTNCPIVRLYIPALTMIVCGPTPAPLA